MPEHSPRRSFLLKAGTFAVAGALVGCDHATKTAALALANRPARSVVSGVLELRYAENHDTAFSLLRDVQVPEKGPILLALSAFALLAVLGTWLRLGARATMLAHLGFAMVVAGALGNVLDRATRGFVVDFIHIEHWPVFNVADIAVVAGVALLGLSALRGARPPSHDEPNENDVR